MFRPARCLILIAVLGVLISSVAAEEEPAREPRLTIPLVKIDSPEFEAIGALVIAEVDPAVLEQTEAKFRRLGLADIQEEPYLPAGVKIYQTISTDLIVPVNLNFIVDRGQAATCFNPEVPYCRDFSVMNEWLKAAGLTIKDASSAKALARFVVAMGISTVHNPNTFQYLGISQDFPIQWFQFIHNIENIYLVEKAPYRSEQKRQEYERVTKLYRHVVRPLSLEQVGDSYRLHGFTYKIMQSAGNLREWSVLVHPDGTVDVDMKELETAIGELYWSFAP